MTNQTFEQLKKTYESGRIRPPARRRAQLNALRHLVTKNRDTFVSLVMADLGRPVVETVFMGLNLMAGEAQLVCDHLNFRAARHPRAIHWMLQPAAGWTIAEPKGVVLIVSPWNYPVLLALGPMADALAADNAVYLEPSELSPGTSKLLTELIPRYPNSEAVRVVEGGPKEADELLKRPFSRIFYTGNGRVGKIVMRAAAEHLTLVTLELGDKPPCSAGRTAGINVATRRITQDRFTNVGQACVVPSCVLTTSDTTEALTERIAAAITEFYGEDLKASLDFGRVINDRHFERLYKLLPVGAVPSKEPSLLLVQVASTADAVMDMAGRHFNTVTTGRGGTREMVDSTNNTAEPTAGSNTVTADDGATISATTEPNEVHKVSGVLDLAGRIVCDDKVDRAAWCITSTVLYSTSPDAPIMKGEIFEPILPTLMVEDVESAIRFINKRFWLLAAYVFLYDHEVRLTFERQTSLGVLRHSLPSGHLLSSWLSLGGMSVSGIGTCRDETDFPAFGHVRTVITKSQLPDTLRFVCPPLDGAKAKLFGIIAEFGQRNIAR